MNKKLLQKKRMMAYFIDAAKQIIDTEGIEKVTIRKVADIAGYNSATLYNYFENLDHLILFASMKYLKSYSETLHNYIKDADNSLEKFFLIWKLFAIHSFSNPKIYHLIFFSKYSTSLNDTILEYYSIFPDELGDNDDNLKSMLLGNTIYSRGMSILEPCVQDNLIRKEYLKELNEITILIYHGMLADLIDSYNEKQINNYVEKLIQYFRRIFESYNK